MGNIKERKTYYFSVEGQTEQWYLRHLEGLINATGNSMLKVSLDCAVKNPLKRVKSMSIINKIEIWHLCDYEGGDAKQFKNTIDNIDKAKKLGKQVTYRLGYSNLTFDLWIIMHKMSCYNQFYSVSQYLSGINVAFCENFQSMDEYKEEKNFKRCLGRIDLKDVISAIDQAEEIMNKNKKNSYVLHNYKGYKYYEENPSLGIHEIIKTILEDCKLIK